MASPQSVPLQHKFTESWKPIWQLTSDDRQYADPPTIPPFPHIDESLRILGMSQVLQDKGITMEFKQQRKYMDGQFSYMHEQFSYMDGQFSYMHEQFSYMHGQFSEIRNELSEVRNEVSELRIEVSEVRIEVSEVRNEVSEVRNEVRNEMNELRNKVSDMNERFEYRFSNLEAKISNSRANKPAARISPVGRFGGSMEAGCRFEIPKPFPTTVGKFWRLKKAQDKRILICLIDFYGIEGWAGWNTDMDNIDSDTDTDTDTDGSQDSYTNIEDAVNSHPDRALEELAHFLGLEYERIQNTMEREPRGQILSKRRQPEVPTEKRARARQLPSLEPPKPSIPHEYLYLPDKSSSNHNSIKSRSAELGWEQPILSSPSLQPSSKASEEDSKSRAEVDIPHRKHSRESSKHSQISTVPFTSAERQAWLGSQGG